MKRYDTFIVYDNLIGDWVDYHEYLEGKWVKWEDVEELLSRLIAEHFTGPVEVTVQDLIDGYGPEVEGERNEIE